MRVISGRGQESPMDDLDRRIHSMAVFAGVEREVSRRMARRRAKRALRTPLLWVAGLVGAGLAWFGRRG
jgi:hypothetical protein